MAVSFFKFFFNKRANGTPETIANEESIFLHNTLSGKKEKFTAIKSGQVGMYHCGPTVYGYQHIGNYRAYVFADTIKRLFLYKGFKVKQIINITDVGHLTDDADQGSDKIEEGAKRDKKSVESIIKLYSDDFLDGLRKLNINTNGTEFPRATAHIQEQIVMIQTLEEKGYTYKTSDGIYFDTALFPSYGRLGNINIKGLSEGARVETNPEKKSPTDFALWKFSKPEEKRQQEWDSPWGKGFPGWHIECSAMSAKYLGHHFDIHTGGIDHIPTHHNNEIAQSECTFGKPPVNYWIHVAHILINDKKISKSLGNTILIKDLENKKILPLTLRYWFLTSHYKTQTNFTWEAIEASATALLKLEKIFLENNSKQGSPDANYLSEFIKAWSDDLDTPKALAIVWKMIKDEKIGKTAKKATLLELDKLLGFGLQNTTSSALAVKLPLDPHNLPKEIKSLVDERQTARTAKNWPKADELRGKINQAGYEIIDSERGQEIRKI